MNSVGITFRKRGHVHPKFGRLRSQIVLYALVPVQSVRLNCNLNNLPVVRKFTIIILFPNELNPCVRQPVRKSGLPNEVPGNL